MVSKKALQIKIRSNSKGTAMGVIDHAPFSAVGPAIE